MRPRYVPLYVLRMIHQFDHRWNTYENGKFREVTESEKQDPTFLAQPEYWVPASEADERICDDRTWLLGWRDVTRSTDQRTVIMSPHPRAGVGNPLPQFVSPSQCLRRSVVVPAVMNSFPCDFAARQKVGGTHLNFFTMKQLAVPEPGMLRAHQAFIEPRVLELCYTAWDMNDLSAQLEYHGPPFHWNPARRALIRAELDALMFRLYGVKAEDVDYIMDTFPIIQREDLKQWGEYRTKRLVLERYDAMTEASLAGRPYQTVLDPPPAHPSVAHDESNPPRLGLVILEESTPDKSSGDDGWSFVGFRAGSGRDSARRGLCGGPCGVRFPIVLAPSATSSLAMVRRSGQVVPLRMLRSVCGLRSDFLAMYRMDSSPILVFSRRERPAAR